MIIMPMKMKDRLVASLPTTMGGWVTNVSAIMLVSVAVFLAALHGSKEDAIVQTLLLNAGLFLGIQNAGRAAIAISESRYTTKVEVAKVNQGKPEVNVNVAHVDDIAMIEPNSGM